MEKFKAKIAVIPPKHKNDYLADTVIDGLFALRDDEPGIEFVVRSGYSTDIDILSVSLDRDVFKDFARSADIIFFLWGKGNTDFELAEEINRFDKTVFIDGSEVGGNRRYDPDIQTALSLGTFEGNGKVDSEMLAKCVLYFKREKPYIENVLPFPFGIERSYTKYYSAQVKKDIDFFCVFGQEEYPILRREVRENLIKFSRKNNFTCFTERVDQETFYKTLTRSKVGISVGGGGFDTARFWEILGNNCLLLTEKIDIYEPDSKRFPYERITEFSDISEFEKKLEKIGNFLKNDYDQAKLNPEYEKILLEHSSKSRVLEIIHLAKEKGIL